MEKEFVFCEVSEERSGRKKVLIVDDDLEMLKIFRFYLQDTYDVSIVNSGKTAMSLMRQEYVPDIVLLDYMMPEYTGAEMFKDMKADQNTKKIAVIFLTGVTDDDTIKECLSYEPAGYIVKPVAKPALHAKLDSFFQQHL